MKKRYYGVAGVNAYGVYNAYDRVLKKRIHIAEFKNKGFSTFDEAKEWAEETYYRIQMRYCEKEDYEIADISKVNKCYYRKKIH